MSYTPNVISNSQDIIDSRDVIARIEHLEELRQEAIDKVTELRETRDSLTEKDKLTEQEQRDFEATEDALASVWKDTDGTEYAETLLWSEDERDELQALKSLADEAGGVADWEDGAALIRDSYFEDYAKQLAEDLGAIGKDLQWPACHIDWEAATDALKQDYSSVDFDGVEYWIRD